MGKFNNKISAEFNPPRQWVLERALSYQNENINVEALKPVGVNCPSHRITVKKNFKTDLASVPRIIWNLIAPWDVARAAIIHDLLYKRIRQYRAKCSQKTIPFEDPKIIKVAKEAADHVFLMAMLDAEPSVPNWKIYPAFWAVRIFGKWSIIPRDEDYAIM